VNALKDRGKLNLTEKLTYLKESQPQIFADEHRSEIANVHLLLG
jgi:hypothetical protein